MAPIIQASLVFRSFSLTLIFPGHAGSPENVVSGWALANSDSSLNDGLRVLQTAINTTLKDTRYHGVLDDALITATTQLVENGERIGLDAATREHYAQLRTQYTKSLP